MSNFYSGSKFFLPLSEIVGLKIDQFNFVLCQVFACGFGLIFSKYFAAHKCRSVDRHLIELAVGIFLTVFCFGYQIWYLLAQSLPVFVFIKVFPLKEARYITLIFVLIFLSFAHVARMYYDYGSYTMDITGPLMVQTQKLSSLPFNLRDGERLSKGEKLRKDYHNRHAVKKHPTILQYFSYMFYFHGLMVGPFVFFADYLRFIEGRQGETLTDESDSENFKQNQQTILSAQREIRFHLRSLLGFTILFMFVLPFFTTDLLLGEMYNNGNLFTRYIVMTIVMFLVRQRYYLAWTMGTLANLMAGFGFNGFDEQKKPTYNIVKNFHFSKVELGTSTKVMIDHWNVSTSLWLRECVYDRMPRRFGTMAVFACSAIWHGYYSGYYLAFAAVYLATTASRYGRQIVRPVFIKSGLQNPYDILTSILSMFSLNFCILPFILLDLPSGIAVWRSLYFIAPIGWILMITVGILFGLLSTKKVEKTL